ncbi:hypothetical protein H2202_008264 [Exophiala xenobiotica]|uniref:Kinetochore protein fta4 n=1 Tax=Vermiconidia calcicola TaxID=1690605 RepID=A0AAV9Q7C5_9PEZI|nr:hypothetical protein H2202_008264 [Exophiala xenobiotica]KAK5535742.1 hypothetical protein LTR25_005644 [Vermiconidia calcicola]KAK5548683.1 hypothetical protein LTR23_001172 [Chaetothyriales sp. CCFEE 6169]KAK5320536.1 hypothetical protein LTR93_006748 [Exophiala xenobiotica]KAK5406011.1 hypothetical protein LTR90_010686 [Exophiala xenobiotica]
MDDQSITSLKAAFIRSQVRHLSTPLEPSTEWQDRATEPEGGHLSDKVVQDVVAKDQNLTCCLKVNEKIKQHNRMVFSQRSQRHVAEQIETLHWNIINAESNDTELDTVIIRRDAELTDTSTIGNLPEDYDDLALHPDHETNAKEAEMYTRLRQDLLDLSQARDALKQKMAKYKSLQRLMEPLGNPQVNIQPNLITKDGELSKELERMRVLLARVTGKVSENPNSSEFGTTDAAPQALSDTQKLAALLEPT